VETHRGSGVCVCINGVGDGGRRHCGGVEEERYVHASGRNAVQAGANKQMHARKHTHTNMHIPVPLLPLLVARRFAVPSCQHGRIQRPPPVRLSRQFDVFVVSMLTPDSGCPRTTTSPSSSSVLPIFCHPSFTHTTVCLSFRACHLVLTLPL
jgi:hypothetical protein